MALMYFIIRIFTEIQYSPTLQSQPLLNLINNIISDKTKL